MKPRASGSTGSRSSWKRCAIACSCSSRQPGCRFGGRATCTRAGSQWPICAAPDTRCERFGKPWDLGIAGPPPGDDPALLVVEGLSPATFERFEWIEEHKGYREALVPAAELNRYPVWRAWECAECEAVAPEQSPGWESELTPWEPRERVSVCPACQAPGST